MLLCAVDPWQTGVPDGDGNDPEVIVDLFHFPHQHGRSVCEIQLTEPEPSGHEALQE